MEDNIEKIGFGFYWYYVLINVKKECGMDIFVFWNNNFDRVKGRLRFGDREVGILMRGNYKSFGKNNEDLIL